MAEKVYKTQQLGFLLFNYNYQHLMIRNKLYSYILCFDEVKLEFSIPSFQTNVSKSNSYLQNHESIRNLN